MKILITLIIVKLFLAINGASDTSFADTFGNETNSNSSNDTVQINDSTSEIYLTNVDSNDVNTTSWDISAVYKSSLQPDTEKTTTMSQNSNNHKQCKISILIVLVVTSLVLLPDFI
ncbi:hypothetical protein BpHYR1_008041 [Brachionus plicatilis]|uniref:Uncharacterized protein n=1 Tax=Brachionus plicatilis TaxID=10195 RepID=A0A3M7T303_BRAPC|nr:hypothetical protein BpHYR1_008041 [Brachionus plicatilis]